MYINFPKFVTNSDIFNFLALKSLESLDISKTNINDDCIVELQYFYALKTLNLSNCHQVSSKGWEHLKSKIPRKF